jgi:hypothetical protein
MELVKESVNTGRNPTPEPLYHTINKTKPGIEPRPPQLETEREMSEKSTQDCGIQK